MARNEGSSACKSKSGSGSMPESLACYPAEVHLLAVDDSLINQKVIKKLLRISAYKVTAVDSRRRALEILGLSGEAFTSVSANAFDINLIITDYCMPGMSGYDLLKKVKESSVLKEILVVIMSSENVPNRIRCLDEGAEDFLLKPVKPTDVKRLRGHVQPQSTARCDDEPEVASSKRKSPSEGLQGQCSERRPRFSRAFMS
ncbi:hypothetical protein GOP47_0003281 [Adiantum capillus-veneris]|uniref:Response regulatory domain-containing protein n=1 Tax=Adiantum capillus-veneris TaxID=13818 RepID=A0A9D4VDG1_ADICA|nr:hypothetical protein GOP47_0003281 [Adiantum capillus-veneris]